MLVATAAGSIVTPGNVGERVGEQAGARVILNQAAPVMVEGMKGAGGDDPGLAKAAAKQRLEAAGAGDERRDRRPAPSRPERPTPWRSTR